MQYMWLARGTNSTWNVISSPTGEDQLLIYHRRVSGQRFQMLIVD